MQNEPDQSNRGDFYVQPKCCMSCGVPQSIAPELVGWRPVGDDELGECYWIRQPANAEELARAIKITHTQELGCHRYAGNDPDVLRRLSPEDCDVRRPDLALRWRQPLEASGPAMKFSLSASEQSGLLAKMWRKLFQRR